MIYLQLYIFSRTLSLCSCGCTPWNVYIQIGCHILLIRDTLLGIITYLQISFLFIMNSVISYTTAAHNDFVSHMLRQWKGLSLTLFMLRIFTNNHDTSFSLDDFAFFANRFNWWSYLHSKSSFLYKAPFNTGCHPFHGYFSKSVRITLYTGTS